MRSMLPSKLGKVLNVMVVVAERDVTKAQSGKCPSLLFGYADVTLSSFIRKQS